MAVQIDTATDYLDLLARIEAFAVLQGWTVHRSTYDEVGDVDGELILGAPGYSGTQNGICAIRSTHDVPSDKYNWEIKGARQFAGEAWETMVDDSPSRWVPLWNDSIPYWLSVDDARLILIARVSTVDMHFHAGFINTYSTDVEYDYPLMIGGSSTANVRWSDQTSSTRAWWSGFNTSKPGDLWMPNGQWVQISSTSVIVWPYVETDSGMLSQIQPTGSNYPLFPIILHSESEPRGVFGEVIGLRYTTGVAAGTGDIINDGVNDHLIAQDVFRNTTSSYCAMELT